MNRAILLTFWLVIVFVPGWLVRVAADVRSHETIPQSGYERCFQDTELTQSIAKLKLQFGPELHKVVQSLLTKARTSAACRAEVVQALVRAMGQATDPAANQYENYFLWHHGASLLADLKATEALDLLIANITLTDGWSIQLSHYPALVAIREMGAPAIPKLQIVLRNDSDAARRQFAALAIAHIGGRQARLALRSAFPRETNPCTKEFLRVSIQAFDNKAKPNHIIPALNGKWLSAFYCL